MDNIMKLYEHICKLQDRKDKDVLLENLKDKIDNGVLYSDINPEIVDILFEYAQNDNEELNSLLLEEFNEFLNEDTILTEGKLLNKIRWKLALFSLRFLKENSINDFLRAYYSDKDGKETEKSKEWVNKSKKEKVKRIRELANEMEQNEKDKIANSQYAKSLEKSALISGVTAGIAGITAVGAYGSHIMVSNAAAGGNKTAKDFGNSSLYKDGNVIVNPNDTDITATTKNYMEINNDPGSKEYLYTGIYKNNPPRHDSWVNNGSHKASGSGELTISTSGVANKTKTGYNSNYIDGKLVSNIPGGGYMQYDVTTDIKAKIGDKTLNDISGLQNSERTNYNNANKLNSALGSTVALLSTIASALFGAMWGSIILAGISTARGLRQAHKANVVRREEIMSELIKNRKNNTALKESLNEAVTFIDNAGNLKTASEDEYNKQMHEYDTNTEIAKYKKSNKKEYKLLDEDIEIIRDFFELNTLNESVNDLSEEDRVIWKILIKSIDFIRERDMDKIYRGIYAENDEKYNDIIHVSMNRKREKLKGILNALSVDKKEELLDTPAARRLKNNPIAKKIVGKVLSIEGGVMTGMGGIMGVIYGAAMGSMFGGALGVICGILYGGFMIILTGLPSLIAGKILKGKYNDVADENAINASEVVKALGKDKKVALAEDYNIYNLLDL